MPSLIAIKRETTRESGGTERNALYYSIGVQNPAPQQRQVRSLAWKLDSAIQFRACKIADGP